MYAPADMCHEIDYTLCMNKTFADEETMGMPTMSNSWIATEARCDMGISIWFEK